MGESTDSVEDYIRKRKKNDKKFMETHVKKLTIMFTDIVGSSEYYRLNGDIKGRTIIEIHNEIVYPIIKDHDGRVVKLTGDGIMACFTESSQGVNAAIQIQEAMQKHDEPQESIKIRVRIGLHTGNAIEEPNDIYGGVVISTSRVTDLAHGNQILISESIYHDIGIINDISFYEHGSYQLKGCEPLSIHEILWYAGQRPIKPKGQITKRDEKELLDELERRYQEELDNQLKKGFI
jgi:Adenylate cyclase, family 3 (some proteins contain HAMP domain)